MTLRCQSGKLTFKQTSTVDNDATAAATAAAAAINISDFTDSQSC